MLSSAVKFTPEHNETTVKLRKEKDCVKVEISGTGKGMSEVKMARIFVKYYQWDVGLSTL